MSATLLRKLLAKRHSLLVLQDELSSHTDLQLALISRSGFDHIDRLVRRKLDAKELNLLLDAQRSQTFFDLDFVEKINPKIISKLEILEESTVDFSGESPMLQLLRLNLNFRAFETLFIWSLISLNFASFEGKILTRCFHPMKNAELNIRVKECLAIDGYILSGPAFVSDEHFQWNSIDSPNFINEFEGIAKCFIGRDYASKIRLLSSLRSVITYGDSNLRFSKIEKLLGVLNNTKVPDLDFSTSVVRVLIRAILAGSQNSEDGHKEHQYVLPLRPSSSINQDIGTTECLRLEGNARGQDQYWQCSIVSELEEVTEVVGAPDNRMSELSDRAHTNATDQRLENLLVFRNWIYTASGQSFKSARGAPSGDSVVPYTGAILIQEDAISEAVACTWLKKILRCDAVTYFRANHSSFTLEGVAFNATTSAHKSWCHDQITAVERLASDSGQSKSALYESFSSGEKKVLLFGGDVVVTDGRDKGIRSRQFGESGLPAPDSTLIIPVQYGGRVYGVIECTSFAPFAFDNSALILIEEFADILAHFFLTQSNAQLASDINDVTVGAVSGSEPARTYSHLAELISQYFLCFSTSIWRPNNYNSKFFELKGHHNRYLESGSGDTPSKKIRFNISSTSSATKIALERNQWILGEIGEPPFDKDWLSAHFREDWSKNGARYIAVIPVIVDEMPIASIVLASKSARFTDVWAPQYEFCSDVVGTALKNVAVLEKVVWDGLSDTSHELRHLSNNLMSAANSLSQSLHPDEFLNDRVSHKIRLSVGDIKRSSEDLALITDVLEPENYMKFFSESKVRSSPTTYHLVKNSNFGAESLRAIWNAQFEYTFDEAHKKGIDFDILWPMSERKCYLDRNLTGSIIRNLISNAIKYSPRGGTVWVVCEESIEDEVLVLLMSNFGPELSREEKNRIFERRFRGFKAESSNIEGLGEGLYQARIFARAQRGFLTHRQVVGERLEENVLHRFTLTFPLVSLRKSFAED